MKFIFSTFICIFIVTNLFAQAPTLNKTIWSIENIEEDGSVFLKKINAGEAKTGLSSSVFGIIFFKSNNKFSRQISCFEEEGSINWRENNTVELSSMAAAMAPDCNAPQDINGIYEYSFANNTMQLIPISEESASNEEEYDGERSETVEAVEAAEVATEAIEAAQQKSSKKTKAKK